MTLCCFICEDDNVPVSEVMQASGTRHFHTYGGLSDADILRIADGNFMTNALLREVAQTVIEAAKGEVKEAANKIVR